MSMMQRESLRWKCAVKDVLDWLLEDNQPSIRYRALTQLLDKPESDPDVKSTHGMIRKKGWAADLLRKQSADGSWVSSDSLYRPKYTSTNWVLLMLADLGLTRKEPRIDKACQLWIERFAKSDGGFGTDNAKKSELCIVGNTARALVKFGYANHPRVRSALEWLVREQKENGGWHCWGKNGVLDAWEGMSAFAAYPRQKWTRSIKRAVENGAEFFLERELYRQGKRYGPWFRFHYPTHYYYDLLVGLDFLTTLGFASDQRLTYAVDLLREKRRSDGRWNLDAIHPDLESSYANWYKKRPPTPLAPERAGEPSKMITFKALKVLKLMGESAARHP
jgi:hypothetical protein